MNAEPSLLPIRGMAARLFVTVKWLRGEAEVGRIPCVRAGRALLFHPETVEALLVEQAKGIHRAHVAAEETAAT